MVDLAQMLEEHGVQLRRSSDGWVNVRCCFCADSSYHLGIHTTTGQVNCWRCGSHKLLETVSALTKLSQNHLKATLTAFSKQYTPKYRAADVVRSSVRSATFPARVMPLLSVPGACKYLTSRKFDPEELEVKWGVMATGPGAVLKLGDRTVDFSYRVIIPVYYKGKMVSYQGRDWTGRNSPKYLSCPNAIEGMPIKSTVYGLDECQERQAVVVEGAFDVWRIGPGAAVALFGIKHRLSQIKLMVERFDHITMLFDPEPRAKLQALSVARALESCGVGVRMIVLPSGDKDPADMSKDELRGVLK